jgi:hypothetical protein
MSGQGRGGPVFVIGEAWGELQRSPGACGAAACTEGWMREEDGAARGIEGLPGGPLGSVAPANSRIGTTLSTGPTSRRRNAERATVAWLTRRPRLSAPMAARLREVGNRNWARKVLSSP